MGLERIHLLALLSMSTRCNFVLSGRSAKVCFILFLYCIFSPGYVFLSLLLPVFRLAGGYAFVFIAQDIQSGLDYALKVRFHVVLFIFSFFGLYIISIVSFMLQRLIASDADAVRNIVQEINFLVLFALLKFFIPEISSFFPVFCLTEKFGWSSSHHQFYFGFR